jgi:hypothetical protein
MLGPIADPPPYAAPVAAVPFAISVAVWYVVSVALLLLAVHWLALAIEGSASGRARRFGFTWWETRLVPLVCILPAAGRTLARGQVNPLVLVLLALWLLALSRGRRITGAIALAIAISIKVIPALLLLQPLYRRDRQTLAGVAIGLTFGLIIIPVAIEGPTEVMRQMRTFWNVTLAPGLGLGSDTSRSCELTNATATDSQSIMTVLHNWHYPRPASRPPQVAPWVRLVHWSIGGILTVLTLTASRRASPTPRDELTLAGQLSVLMIILSPVCHLHYFLFALPLVIVLSSDSNPRRFRGLLLIFAALNAASLLTVFQFRDFGTTTLAALALWAAAFRLRNDNSQIANRGVRMLAA